MLKELLEENGFSGELAETDGLTIIQYAVGNFELEFKRPGQEKPVRILIEDCGALPRESRICSLRNAVSA